MKPNIILLTVGCANSTTTMRQLQALGWQLGPADNDYAEIPSIRRHNSSIIRGWPMATNYLAELLAGLDTPWALKDPRFAHTLDHWKPLLADYRPLLLWVTKDLAYVRESFRRRFQLDSELADKRQRLCQLHFDAWPYAKLQLDAAQIAAAAELFDPVRAFSGGV